MRENVAPMLNKAKSRNICSLPGERFTVRAFTNGKQAKVQHNRAQISSPSHLSGTRGTGYETASFPAPFPYPPHPKVKEKVKETWLGTKNG